MKPSTLVVLGFGLLACGDRAATTVDAPTAPADEAATTATTATAAETASPAPEAAAPPEEEIIEASPRAREDVARMEARRVALRRLEDEPLLRAHAATIREHFGPDHEALDAQIVAQPGSDRATVWLASGDATPLLLALDVHTESSFIAWSRDRPLAGTFPGAKQMALAGGVHEGASLGWYDPTSHLVALRKWRSDGVPEADFMLGPMDDVDAISALFWPRRGWVVVASKLGEARAFLLGLDGTLAWERGGVALSLGRTSTAPVSIAPLGDDAVMLVAVGTATASGRKAPEHVVAASIDAWGRVAWQGLADLGPARAGASRVAIEPAGEGVRVDVGGRPVLVDGTGTVRRAR